MERYLTYPVAPLQDRMAVHPQNAWSGPKTLANPQSYGTGNVMWCATMALNGLIRVGVPRIERIGCSCTALHGIDHADAGDRATPL